MTISPVPATAAQTTASPLLASASAALSPGVCAFQPGDRAPLQWGATREERRDLYRAFVQHGYGDDLAPIVCNPNAHGYRGDELPSVYDRDGQVADYDTLQHGLDRYNIFDRLGDPDLGFGVFTNRCRAIRVTPPAVRHPMDEYPRTTEEAVEGLFYGWATRLHYPDGRVAYLFDELMEATLSASETFTSFDGCKVEILADLMFIPLAGAAPGGGRYRRSTISWDRDFNETITGGWKCLADSPLYRSHGRQWARGLREELEATSEELEATSEELEATSEELELIGMAGR